MICLVVCSTVAGAQDVEQVAPRVQEQPLEVPELSPTLRRILDSPAIDDATRDELRLFHGQWEALDPDDPAIAARLAWSRFEVNAPSLDDPQTPALLRARAALFRGDAARVAELLADDTSAPALLLKARALEQHGRLAEAVTLLTPLRDRFQHQTSDDPAELTAAAEAIVMLGHLEGRPSQDYHRALRMLGRATQELDPLYWPAHVAEGHLLQDKGNREEAGAAYEQALTLNPTAGEAWAGLGRLAVESFNFDLAGQIVEQLRQINPNHPLADEVAVRSFLRQRDVASARQLLEPALQSLPDRPELRALAVATAGMAYDKAELRDRLAEFDRVAPGSPLAHYTAGETLSIDRQYPEAEALLREAVRRSPNWAAPRLELGLLLMQSGDLAAARVELADAARLDPFHVRVNNQLRLAEDLLGVYQTIESEHFVIRYRPGIDAVLARDMPEPLEAIHRELTAVFQHRPAEKTQIDVMPDQATFAVRITGMPHIWTIAAATGDVISLTPPRSGPGQANPYNWVNVLRHELVHTITLAQTRNRVPHWFTEACAVSVETTGRTYETCRLLASALRDDELFDYDQINWGFVRPKTPRDRPLAYAQSDWMLEFIAARWSHQAIVDLLELYRQGVSDTDALRQVTGYDSDAFMQAFLQWARQQVIAWGLDRPPLDGEDAAWVKRQGRSADLSEIIDRVQQQPDPHPDLIKLVAERMVDDADDPAEAERWLTRYAQLRPTDPWPQKGLVRLAIARGEPERALGPLQMLDRSDTYSAAWAHQLAQLHRAAGRLDAAGRAIQRALHGEPYNAAYRELAAAIALQQGDLSRAAFHVESLEILEPDRAQHPTRLAVIYDRLGRADDAADAADRALARDSTAPVKHLAR